MDVHYIDYEKRNIAINPVKYRVLHNPESDLLDASYEYFYDEEDEDDKATVDKLMEINESSPNINLKDKKPPLSEKELPDSSKKDASDDSISERGSKSESNPFRNKLPLRFLRLHFQTFYDNPKVTKTEFYKLNRLYEYWEHRKNNIYKFELDSHPLYIEENEY